ncbi:MAG: hypothetical protein ACLT8E_03260 [Akkermansia sp.]
MILSSAPLAGGNDWPCGCARDGACLQSYKEADGIYHCEIVFKTGSCARRYSPLRKG